ncbi:MAG: thioredoxin-disulfide reductase [Alphaproteobacteria bacterium]|nr:thioredoxin-disulfide reductase [Alphaproteobacteria bacterium]
MGKEISTRVIIIGSGAAGYTAAIYAARANLKPVLVTGYEPGGQLTLTQEVENYPGFAAPIIGPDLMGAMRAQAESCGTTLLNGCVKSVDFSKKPFRNTLDNGTVIMADSVIIATGAQARWLDIPGEEKFRGYGVSSCATCDGFFFKGAPNVVVTGGGNTAVEEAMFLAELAKKVTLVHRRDTLRATPVLQERLFATPNIECVWNATLSEIHGTDGPKSISHVTINTPNGQKRIDTKAVFVAIGHTPCTSIFQDQITLDPAGYILIEKNKTGTNVEGVFAAGDVQDTVFRQAITAAGQGCMAALEAEKYLKQNNNQHAK